MTSVRALPGHGRLAGSLLLVAALAGAAVAPAPGGLAAARPGAVFEGPVAAADCGPGSKPETALQGQVPLAERSSGRSQKGYRCNMELVSQYQGVGASWQFAWYDDCAYYGTYSQSGEGVAVIDASKRKRPALTTKLVTPAMEGPWESLKVNNKRGLLAAVAAQSGAGPLFFDVYDISDDCAQPELLATTPLMVPNGHEGNWAQDGRTYYGASTLGPSISVIDTTDPAAPQLVTVLDHGTHGLSTSADGNWLYLTGAACGNGLEIVDVSQIQAREPNPQAPLVGEVCWPDGSAAQHPIPVTIKDKPYIIFVDEGGGPGPGGTGPLNLACCAGAARLIDISDPSAPRVVSKFKLEIHLPEHGETAAQDTAGNGVFGYQYHYCNVDRLIEPTVLGCAAFQSGIRVIDIRDPMRPAEIAYFNPPAQVGKGMQLRGSEHAGALGQSANLTTDWCAAQLRFVPARRELWTSCMDNGFLRLKLTNGVWPFDEHRRQDGPTSSSG